MFEMAIKIILGAVCWLVPIILWIWIIGIPICIIVKIVEVVRKSCAGKVSQTPKKSKREMRVAAETGLEGRRMDEAGLEGVEGEMGKDGDV